MTDRTLVIAPHPDDEILGCGGTLLRRKTEGAELGWLIVTGISERDGWSTEQKKRRDAEISQVNELVGFSQVFNLGLPTTQLDRLPMRDLIEQFFAVAGPHWFVSSLTGYFHGGALIGVVLYINLVLPRSIGSKSNPAAIR